MTSGKSTLISDKSTQSSKKGRQHYDTITRFILISNEKNSSYKRECKQVLFQCFYFFRWLPSQYFFIKNDKN